MLTDLFEFVILSPIFIADKIEALAFISVVIVSAVDPNGAVVAAHGQFYHC
mgnify:CR=1 FL=1